MPTDTSITSVETRGLQIIPGSREDASSSIREASKLSPKLNWQHAVRAQLTTISDIRDNWDGYGATPIAFETVLFSLQVLTEIWMPGLPVPDISPKSDGGLMVEWFTGECELTLEIDAPYNITYTFEDIAEDASEEGRVSQNIAKLDVFLNRIRASGTQSISAA